MIYEYSRASIEHPERNEDATLIFTRNSRAPVFAVIDGMGGHQHQNEDGQWITGRDASQLVRETLIEDLGSLPASIDASPGGEAETRAIAALKRAHEQVRLVLNGGNERPLTQRVGAVATVTIVCEDGKRLLTVQVGDTRGYIFSGGELIQLLPDEDNVEYLVQQRLLSHEDAERITRVLNTYNGVDEPQTEGTVTINGSPYDLYIAWRWFMVGNTVLNIPGANVVISALGVHEDDPEPQTSRIEIAPGDCLFLCSDGLYKNLTEGEMLNGLRMPGDSATFLGDAAFARSQDHTNRRSTQDDISVVLVKW